jgi:hypothetical protein
MTAARALDAYLAGLDPESRAVVVALDRAVRKAYADFDVAVKYRMLMYTIGADWRTWVCAIGTSKQRVHLRFLYGVLLDDPREVLRAGSSVLKTWDFAFDEAVNARAVGAYVKEAVARYDEYKVSGGKVLEASRAAGTRGRPSKSR